MQIKSALFLKRLIIYEKHKISTGKHTHVQVILTQLQQSVQAILKTVTPFHSINCDHSVLILTL